MGIDDTLVPPGTRATNAFDMGIEACPVRRTKTEEATVVWVSVTFLASSKLLLAKPRTQVEHDWSFQKQRASVFSMGVEQSMACPRTVRRQ